MLSELTGIALFILPVLLLVSIMLAGVLLSLRRQRNCPACRTPMRLLPQTIQGPAAPTYEVLVCDGCSNCATLVHGHQARFAYCPSCLNRSLHAPSIRQTDGSVKVHERCELCGFHAERTIGGHIDTPELPRLGQVIAFPSNRVPRRRTADDGS